jgi:hypothetical protein
MNRPRRIAIYCGAFAFLVSVAAVLLSIVPYDWNITALIRMSPTDPMSLVARSLEDDFAFNVGGHYDGVYFYAIALDPVATELPNFLIDYAAYRYSHAGYGWAAWALSFGQANAVPWALAGISVASMGISGFLASRLFDRFGLSAWFGLLVGLNPGLLYAVTADTSEPFALVVLLGGLWAWFSERHALAGILFAVACLIKEPLVLVPLGLLLYELLRVRDDSGPTPRNARLLMLAITPLPLVIWWMYLYAAFGDIAVLSGPPNISLPFVGWAEAFDFQMRLTVLGGDKAQIGTGTLPITLAIGVGLLILGLRTARIRRPLDGVLLLFVLLAFVLGDIALAFPKDIMRIMSIHLVLVPFAFTSVRGSLSLRSPPDG